MKVLKKCVSLCLMLMLCVVPLTSCSSEEVGGEASKSGGSVAISFSISSSSATYTRADNTKNGNESLNENTVERLDLFIFNQDGSLYKPAGKSFLSLKVDGGTVLYPTSGSGTWTDTGLSVNDVTGKTLYLVANHTRLANGEINLEASGSTEESEFQKMLIETGSSFNPSEKQALFVMDGSTANLTFENGNKEIHFDLARALSKVRLTLLDKNGNEMTTDSAVSYKFVHYVTDGTVVTAKSEDEAKVQVPQTMQTTLSGNEVKISEKDSIGKKAVVFYSYPNYWYDADKNMYEEEPIDTARQTYIMVRAPFDGQVYNYKVPVNYRLPLDNDSANPDPSFINLYQLRRNHIYDVTATIDRKGGEDEPTEIPYTTEVKDWTDTDKIIIDFDK